jgi:AraC family transcriptional regulator
MAFATTYTELMSATWSTLRRLRVRAAGVAVYPPRATFGPRRLKDFEFVWIVDGGATADFDGQRIAAPAGTLLLARPGMLDRYDWGDTRGATHAFVHFDFDRRPRGWPPVAQWPLSRTLPADDVVRPLFRYLLSLHWRPGQGQHAGACVEVMLRAFVTGQFQTVAEPVPDLPAAVKAALQTIYQATMQNPPAKLTLTKLAGEAHVSPEHLCRLFARHLDLGPLECVRLARLERAATLLGRSDMAVKEIAAALGFASPYHLSGAFKKVYTLSPVQYRAKRRQGAVPAQNPIVRLLAPP